MRLFFAILMGALLTAAPPFPAVEMLSYTLDENAGQLRRLLGEPKSVADLSDRYRTLQYQIDSHDAHDFSHIVCVRRSDGRLISVTRNYDDQRSVEALFPSRSGVATYHWPNASAPQYSVRARHLPGGRVLLAMGAAKPGDVTSQLLLIRRDALADFLPWLDQQLAEAGR